MSEVEKTLEVMERISLFVLNETGVDIMGLPFNEALVYIDKAITALQLRYTQQALLTNK